MKKLIAGPMASLSHEAFRRIVEQFGCTDEYFTEMINAPSLLQHGPFEKYYLMNGPCPKKIVWQLTGREEESMEKAIPILSDLGGIGIDINMGCSAPEIFRSGAGIAWMIKPLKETMSMVSKIKKAIEKSSSPKMRLSVKLRLGNDDFVEKDFFNFCTALVENGVELLTLHPRTRREKLTQKPRYFYAEDLACRMKSKNIPVIVNGNIKDEATARAVLLECPSVNGIMISRALAQKPWIFKELKNTMPQVFSNKTTRKENDFVPCETHSARTENNCTTVTTSNTCANENTSPFIVDRLNVGLQFLEYLKECQPKEFYRTRIKRFFYYYCDTFSFAHYIKSKMLNCTDIESAYKTFCSYFDECPEDRYFELSHS